jgi:hypothetical protein
MLVSTPDECCLIFRLRDDFKWVSSLDGAVNTLLDHVVRHGHNELLLWSLGALMCESDEAVVDSWIEKKRNSEWFGKRCGSCEEALADVSNKCSSCHRPKFASVFSTHFGLILSSVKTAAFMFAGMVRAADL